MRLINFDSFSWEMKKLSCLKIFKIWGGCFEVLRLDENAVFEIVYDFLLMKFSS